MVRDEKAIYLHTIVHLSDIDIGAGSICLNNLENMH